MLLFFFFQAEDGIRDKLVTGVQTCALPIFPVDSVPVAVDGQILERKAVQEPQRNDRRRKKNRIGKPATHVRSSTVPVEPPGRAGISGLPSVGLTASDITCCDMTEYRPLNVGFHYSRQSSQKR